MELGIIGNCSQYGCIITKKVEANSYHCIALLDTIEPYNISALMDCMFGLFNRVSLCTDTSSARVGAAPAAGVSTSPYSVEQF